MYKLVFTFLFYFVSLSTFCQSFSYGIKTGYITYNRLHGKSVVVEGTQVSNSRSSSAFMDGWRFAGLTRIEHKRLLVQAELAYSYNIGGNGTMIIIDNYNNPSNNSSSDYWKVGEMPLLKNVELSLTGGYKPVKWLRLYTGLGLWYQRSKEKPMLVLYNVDEQMTEEAREHISSLNEMNRFYYGIQKSFVPWVVAQQIGIGVDIKRNFSVDIAYDRSLSSVSKHLTYKDQQYRFKQRLDRFVLSIAYRFYRLKKQ